MAIWVALSLAYVLMVMAVGAIYVILGHSGVFLTGMSVLLISLSVLSFATVAAIRIVDHYDTRENETTYRAASMFFLKATPILLMVGVAWALLEGVLSAAGVRNSQIELGFASRLVLYSPDLSARYGKYVSPVIDNTWLIAGISIAIAAFGTMTEKSKLKARQRLSMCALGFALLGGVTLGMAHTADELISGELTIGSRRSVEVIDAQDAPAKFNAVLLTQFSLCGLLGFVGIGFVVASILKKSKAAPSPSRKSAGGDES